jgi:hypothetical protein
MSTPKIAPIMPIIAPNKPAITPNKAAPTPNQIGKVKIKRMITKMLEEELERVAILFFNYASCHYNNCSSFYGR